jgi:hypothetical protein
MNRKLFLKKISAAFLLSTPLLSLIGCSEDEASPVQSPSSEPNCIENGTGTSIGSNHKHSILVSADDVSRGETKTYNIQGDSEHGHQVTVTSSHFSKLKNNESVSIDSSSDSGHLHAISIGCK